LTPRPPRPTLFPYTTLFRSSPDQTRHIGIGAGIIMAIDSSFDADNAPLGQEFARQRALAWAYRKREQRCAAFRETPPMITPCIRSEEHTSELQSRFDLVCRL